MIFGFVRKKLPVMLTGLAAVGAVGSVVLGVAATPKAMLKIKAAEDAKKKEFGEEADLTPMEVIRSCWIEYIPTALSTGVTISCILGASNIYTRQNAALIGLYGIAERSLRSWQETVRQNIGDKAYGDLKGLVGAEEAKNIPEDRSTILIANKSGHTLFYDTISGRHFYSDIDVINRVINDLNREIRMEGYVTLNQFYNRVGLPPIELGVDSGWNPEYWLDVTMSPVIKEETNEVIINLSYMYQPRPF